MKSVSRKLLSCLFFLLLALLFFIIAVSSVNDAHSTCNGSIALLPNNYHKGCYMNSVEGQKDLLCFAGSTKSSTHGEITETKCKTSKAT